MQNLSSAEEDQNKAQSCRQDDECFQKHEIQQPT